VSKENPQKALELVCRFIRLEREYRSILNIQILERRQKINEEYIKVNGSGDLFVATGSLDLKRPE